MKKKCGNCTFRITPSNCPLTPEVKDATTGTTDHAPNKDEASLHNAPLGPAHEQRKEMRSAAGSGFTTTVLRVAALPGGLCRQHAREAEASRRVNESSWARLYELPPAG